MQREQMKQQLEAREAQVKVLLAKVPKMELVRDGYLTIADADDVQFQPFTDQDLIEAVASIAEGQAALLQLEIDTIEQIRAGVEADRKRFDSPSPIAVPRSQFRGRTN